LDFGFGVGDVISWVSFWPYWPRFPGPGCQPQREFFDSNFHWKLGYSPSLLSLRLAL